MKKYQIFLSYYSILVSTILLLWSLFHAGNPQGLLLTLLLIPISLYFGLLVTGSFKTKSVEDPIPMESRNQNLRFSLFVFLFTLCISTISIFFYSLINNRFAYKPQTFPETSQQITDLRKELEKAYRDKGAYEEIALELNQVKNELAKIRAGQKSEGTDVLGIDNFKQGSESSTISQGVITIKDSDHQTVSVYQEKNISSKVTGKAQFGTSYLYTKKENNWYFIMISDNQNGWINNSFVKEVN